ncbi:UDP-3-O-acyl-N-acetylglucosamine deacetylase, partial [Hansschlegelia beijingensis]
LRMPDEPVRHRVLDLVGDYALAGRPLLGRVTAVMPGHEHNHAMVAILLADRAAWEEVEIDESGEPRPVG